VADLVRELARRLGTPHTIVPMPTPEGVIEAIRTQKADIGFLTYNEERARQVDFSDEYLLSTSAFLVRADSDIRRSDEVDRSGITIGAIKGQTQQLYLSERMRLARVEVLPVAPPPAEVAGMLVSGKVDVFGANRQRMEEAAQTTSRVRVLSDNFMVTGQAIVVEKGHPARVGELNRFLDEVKASGFVRASVSRANVAGVEIAPPRQRP
jgi:polar amino acid transport system substrate-binding protein